MQVQALLQVALGAHHQLLFNQHQLTVVACCVYAAARVACPDQKPLAFRRITDAISALLPLQPLTLFTDADVGGVTNGAAPFPWHDLTLLNAMSPLDTERV